MSKRSISEQNAASRTATLRTNDLLLEDIALSNLALRPENISPGKLWDLGYPTSVFLKLTFDVEVHFYLLGVRDAVKSTQTEVSQSLTSMRPQRLTMQPHQAGIF